MARYSSRKDAITCIKIRECSEALVYLLQEQLDYAEEELLGCSPTDPLMRDKLVKAQTFRHLVTTLKQDLK